MLLSYKVIKNDAIKNTGAKEIVTQAEIKTIDPEKENNIKNHFESYEALAKTMVDNARKQGEDILSKAYDEARIIEEEALKNAEAVRHEAFEQGFREGQKQGYSTAYSSTIEKAKSDAQIIIASAEEMLNGAKAEYEEYMKNKTEEINSLILTITGTILKKELQNTDCIKAMILEALEGSKRSSNFIIRTNSAHAAELKVQTESLKEQLGLKGDIFIVADNSLESGNALIDRGNGKIMVGTDSALLKIKDILEGKE